MTTPDGKSEDASLPLELPEDDEVIVDEIGLSLTISPDLNDLPEVLGNFHFLLGTAFPPYRCNLHRVRPKRPTDISGDGKWKTAWRSTLLRSTFSELGLLVDSAEASISSRSLCRRHF